MTDPAGAGDTAPAAHPSIGALLDVLAISDTPARTTEDIFTGVSQMMPHGRIYGGQVLAQSLVAAARTTPVERTAHSMHGYFLRPGDSERGLTLSVDRIHDGRSFSTRRTQAFQAGVPIFSMIASFQTADAGLEHQEGIPAGVPDPDDLPRDEDLTPGLHPMTRRAFDARPVDIRHVQGPIYDRVEGDPVPAQALWMRLRGRLPDDPLLHRATLAYLSDLTIQEPVLRAHGLPWQTPGLKVASLDHAMWWHRDHRVDDDWLLYVQSSPSARGGRGLATGRIFARDGVLLATVAQEIMVRVPDDAA